MVETDRFVQLSAQVVDESQREEGLGIGRVQTYALLQKIYCIFVLFQLAAGVSKICQDCFHHPKRGFGVAES